jgi:hypothetical protein
MKRFPRLHNGEYTELKVAYMSKMVQAELARKMGLSANNRIRVAGLARANLNLEADVFESFFGALDTLILMIRENGAIDDNQARLISTYCDDMITHLFRDIEIDINKGRGSYKTQVIQMFVRFDLPKPEEISPGTTVTLEAIGPLRKILATQGITSFLIGQGTAGKKDKAKDLAYRELVELLMRHKLIKMEVDQLFNKKGASPSYTVKLKREHLEFLASYGVKIENPIIGQALASTKKEAQYEAYKQAFDLLEYYGITTEWADAAKQHRDFLEPSTAQYLEAAQARLTREKFEQMYFFIPRKTVTPKGAIVQLVGIRDDHQEEVLAYLHTDDKENSYRQAKTELLRSYGGQ